MTTTADDDRCTSRQLDPVFRCTLPAGHGRLHRSGLKEWGDPEPCAESSLSVDELAAALGHTVPSAEEIRACAEWVARDELDRVREQLAAADQLSGELSRRLTDAERRATAYSNQLEDCRNGRDQLRDDLEQVTQERDAARDELADAQAAKAALRHELDTLRAPAELHAAVTEPRPVRWQPLTAITTIPQVPAPLTFYASPVEPPVDLIPSEREVEIVDADGKVLGRATVTTATTRAEAEERRRADLAEARKQGALTVIRTTFERVAAGGRDWATILTDLHLDAREGKWAP